MIISEEEYLNLNGASRQGIGEAALHKNRRNISDKIWKKIVNAQAEKDIELINRREVLRAEYRKKVASGEIKEKTRLEQRIDTANGHPDNEATQAARRLLEKRNIKWNILNKEQ